MVLRRRVHGCKGTRPTPPKHSGHWLRCAKNKLFLDATKHCFDYSITAAAGTAPCSFCGEAALGRCEGIVKNFLGRGSAWPVQASLGLGAWRSLPKLRLDSCCAEAAPPQGALTPNDTVGPSYMGRGWGSGRSASNVKSLSLKRNLKIKGFPLDCGTRAV